MYLVTEDSTDATDVCQMDTEEVDNEISTELDSDLPLCPPTGAVKSPLPTWLLWQFTVIFL